MDGQERYTRDPEPFDWYQRWAGLKDTFSEFAQPSNAILMLGCGNSRLSEASESSLNRSKKVIYIV